MAAVSTKQSVTLRNLTRVALPAIELLHGACCDEVCQCAKHIVGVRDHDPETGERHVRAIPKRLPKSVTLMARGTPGDVAMGLPPGAANLPQVVALQAAGKLAVTVNPIEPAAPAQE